MTIPVIGISVATGLVVAVLLDQMVHPFTLTRFAVYGSLVVVAGVAGMGWCDRLRGRAGRRSWHGRVE